MSDSKPAHSHSPLTTPISARQDIPDHGEVIKLIQKIYEVRKTKARASLKQLKQIEYKVSWLHCLKSSAAHLDSNTFFYHSYPLPKGPIRGIHGDQ